jgi:hypothetical protein
LRLTNIAVFGLMAAGLAAPLASHAEECEGAPTANKLSIVIEGVRSNQGQMTASLYPDDKTAFLAKNGALKVWRVAAEAPSTTTPMPTADWTWACWDLPRTTASAATHASCSQNHPLLPCGFQPPARRPRFIFASIAATRRDWRTSTLVTPATRGAIYRIHIRGKEAAWPA